MEHSSTSQPELFSFSLFEPFSDIITAGITGSRNHFNLALHTGEDENRTLSNRRQLCTTLGIPPEKMTVTEQIHGNNTVWIGPDLTGRGYNNHEEALKGYDAMITEERQTLLTVFLADCIPVLLFDKKNKRIASCHAGWRGTAGNIIYKTVEIMKKRGSDPRNMFAGIGPGIGSCCFTVGEDVLGQLEEFPYRENCRGEKGTFDLKKANQLQLEAAGIPPENIEIMPFCTCCGKDTFFSYRKSGGAGGRFSAFIALK